MKNLKRTAAGVILSFYGAVAADLFVEESGSGTLCTQAVPCQLSEAVGQAVDGSIIYMGEGNYTVFTSPMITLDRNPVQLVGGWDGNDGTSVIVDPDRYETVIDGNETYQCISLGVNSSVHLEGLRIVNCRHDDNGSAIYGGDVDVLEIQNVYFGKNHAENSTQVPTYGGAVYFRGNRLTITDSEFEDNRVNSNWSFAGAVAADFTQCRIERCVFRGNDSWNKAVLHAEGAGMRTSQFVFNDNNVTGNGRSTVGSSSIYAIYVRKTQVTMKGNRIERNFTPPAASVQASLLGFEYVDLTFAGNSLSGNGFARAVLEVQNDSDFEIYNNFIVRNFTDKTVSRVVESTHDSDGNLSYNTMADNNSSDGVYLDSGSMTVWNNIFNDYNVSIHTKAGTVTAKNNLFENVARHVYDDGGTTTESGSIDGFARFLDASSGDYHLRKNSDALDEAAANGVDVDYDGDARPQGPLPDIGADEYTPGREPAFNPSVMMYLLN